MYRVHFYFYNCLQLHNDFDCVTKMAKFVLSLVDQGLSTDIRVERV